MMQTLDPKVLLNTCYLYFSLADMAIAFPKLLAVAGSRFPESICLHEQHVYGRPVVNGLL